MASEVKQISSAGNEPIIGIFGEQLVASYIDDVTVKFIYPFYNTGFDLAPAEITGDGAVTVTDAQMNVSSAETGTILVSSKESIRYRSGKTGYAEFTASFVGNGKGMAGCFDAVDGFYIKRELGVMKVGRRRAGVDYDISFTEWNGGANLSNIDFNKKNIFVILFGYLGIASPIFCLKKERLQILHILHTEGILDTTTVTNPLFPVSVYAENGMTVTTASWSGGVFLGNDSNAGSRPFATKLSKTLPASTAVTTVGTFRNKTTYKTVENKVKAKLVRYAFYVDAPDTGTGTVEITIHKNATLAGVASYTDIDADNSVMEADTVQTYSSGGRVLLYDYLQYSSATGNNAKQGGGEQLPADKFGLYLLPNETATITAQNVSGTTAVTVRVVFNWEELF